MLPVLLDAFHSPSSSVLKHTLLSLTCLLACLMAFLILFGFLSYCLSSVAATVGEKCRSFPRVRKRDIPTRCKKGKEVKSCPKARNALLGAMSFHAVRVRFHFSLRLDARRNRKEFRSFGSEILVRSSTFLTPPLI